MKISIITPTYNSEKTIKRTIESVLNQNYTDVEYIIIDGKSTDKTLKIISQYEEKFKNKGFIFKFISEKDEGIADAFNKGIRLATGDLVGIINSDDWLNSDALLKINENYNARFGIICGNLNLFKEGEYIKTRKSRPYLLWLGMYIMHPTVFVKRELYDKYSFNKEYKIAMDFDFILQLRKVANQKIKYLPYIISNMEMGGASSDIKKMKQEEMVVIKKYYNFFIVLLAKFIKIFNII